MRVRDPQRANWRAPSLGGTRDRSESGGGADGRVQAAQAIRVSISCALAIAGLTLTLLRFNGPVLPLTGLLWILVSAGCLGPIIETQHSRAVIAQEMFDTELFRLPWNSGLVGEPVDDVSVHALRRPIRAGSRRERYILSGWYLDTDNVPFPHDVLLCQLQNTGWDTQLRRRYGYFVVGSLASWIGIGVVVGAVASMSVGHLLLQWFVPSIGAAAIALDVSIRQRRAYVIRERLLRLILALLSDIAAKRPTDVSSQWLRYMQDGIFLARTQSTRVPNLFYLIFRESDEREFSSIAKEYRDKLAVPS